MPAFLQSLYTESESRGHEILLGIGWLPFQWEQKVPKAKYFQGFLLLNGKQTKQKPQNAIKTGIPHENLLVVLWHEHMFAFPKDTKILYYVTMKIPNLNAEVATRSPSKRTIENDIQTHGDHNVDLLHVGVSQEAIVF